MQVYIGDGSARRYLARGAAEREFPVFRSFASPRLVEVVDFVQGDYAQAKARGNLRHLTEFTVDREHASVEAANTFLFQHSMELQSVEGTFVFVSEDGRSRALFYLKNAALEAVSFGPPLGVTTEATYRIVGGRIDTQP